MFRIINLLGWFLLPTIVSFALPTDRYETVYIRADSSTHNYKTGIDRYEGNVAIDQGTTHITAERLITKKDRNHRIYEAVAFGFNQLVHFWTTPKMGQAVINAHAKIIQFYPLSTNVTLKQQVEITQERNTFKGELIHYNKSTQTINVPASKNARAVIIYRPRDEN